jgi:hypothetical protein
MFLYLFKEKSNLTRIHLLSFVFNSFYRDTGSRKWLTTENIQCSCLQQTIRNALKDFYGNMNRHLFTVRGLQNVLWKSAWPRNRVTTATCVFWWQKKRRQHQCMENRCGQPTSGNPPTSPAWVLRERLTPPHLKKSVFCKMLYRIWKLDGRDMWHAWDRREMHAEFWCGKLKQIRLSGGVKSRW